MNHNTIGIVSAAILVSSALAGPASAEHRDGPARNSVRLAELSALMETSLAEAVALAEKHTDGVAIGIQLTTNKQTFMTDANGLKEFRGKAWRDKALAHVHSTGAETNQTDNERRAGKPGTSEATPSRVSGSALFAIVTCVIDQTRIRDVVIDMSDGSVLGMQSVNATGQSPRTEYQRDTDVTQSQHALVRASALMNATARNAENERVGDIDELVLNPDSNRIIYGVLRRGGFMGFNESRYALPANELAVPENGRILLNLSNTDFEGHSGFDDDKWPTQADPEWSTSWSRDAEKMPRATRILKATDLIGTNVQCSGGEKVGDIADLIVEPRSARVVYAIVTTANGRIVVPMSVLKPMGGGRVMKMTHAEVMALPRLGPDTEPDWNNARWNRRIHDDFNTDMNLTAVATESQP